MKINKLDKLKQELKEQLFNNLEYLSSEQATKVLDILKNGKASKIKSTLNRIKDNEDKEDIIINKKKVIKKVITKKEQKVISDSNTDNIIKYYKNLNKQEKDKINKRNEKNLAKAKIISKEMDIDKVREEEQKINKENNIRNNSNNYFLNVAMTKEYMININIVDVYIFLNKLKDTVINDIDKIRINKFNNSIKLIFVLKVLFEKVVGHENGVDIVENQEAFFYHNATTKEEKKNNIKNNINISMLSKNDINNTYDLLGDQFKKLIENFNLNGSSWYIKNLEFLRTDISKYKHYAGGSYFELEDRIKSKRCCINPQNKDEECFKWSILAGLYHNEIKHNPERIYNLVKYEDKINTSMLQYPVNIDMIEDFEKENDIPLCVYELNEENKDEIEIIPIYTYKIVSNNKPLNLLLISNEEKNHYVFIKNLRALLKNNTNSNYPCEKCKQLFSTEQAYENHMLKNKCDLYDGEAMKILPKEKEDFITFKNYQHRHFLPFNIYYDTEAMLKNIKDEKGNYQLHLCKHVGVKLVSRYPNLLNDSYKQFDGENCMLDSLNYIMDLHDEIIKICLKKGIKMIITDEQEKEFNNSTHCYICNNKFFNENDKYYEGKENKKINDKTNKSKVRDHDHLNGLYRGAAHYSCNLKCNWHKYIKVPVIAHNAKGYDSHFIFQYIGLLKNKMGKERCIEVIPLTDEKYLSFKIDKAVFLDSMNFMNGPNSSLEKLVEALNKSKNNNLFKNFNEGFNNITEELNNLLRQKGVFPYDYYNNENVLLKGLPNKKAFDNKLYNSVIDDKDYERAQKVYNLSNCKNFKDYLDLYLKTDVLLLADVFEAFRESCMKYYGLDPSHYYTSPGFSWDSMMLGYHRNNPVKNHINKKPKNYKLHIKNFKEGQEDMLEMIKSSMKGGISIITHRYAKANNKYMGDNYNPNEESSYIIYLDANNLYGWAMNQYLPIGEYEWENNITLEEILKTLDENDIGYIIECDIEIPEDKHDYFSCYPPCVENTNFKPSPHMDKIKKELNIKDSHVNKLIPNLFNKTKYVLHYRNLKLFTSLGCIVKKIHRVLKFKQEPYLQDYIKFNTQMRTETNNEHEKELFKLLNNSIFGKTMENVEKRIEVKIVSTESKFLKHASKPYFKSFKIFNNNLAAVHLNKTTIEYNKPVIVGFSILELSKYHMYNFHYNTMKRKYKDDIKLLFTDTDSLCYQIKTDDLYKDLSKMNYNFDFSEYDKNNICYNIKNKKIVGKFKCETNGKIIDEFLGIRSKMYKLSIYEDNKMKYKGTMKGIKRHIAEKININDYKDCIFNNKITNHNFNVIEQKMHIIRSNNKNKIGLSPYDDKRFYLDNISSRPYGHYLN